MKVKELIEKLQKCNPEAEAIGYTYLGEQDFVVEDVEEVLIDGSDDDPYEVLEYCGGCSVVEDDFIGKPIVYIKG